MNTMLAQHMNGIAQIKLINTIVIRINITNAIRMAIRNYNNNMFMDIIIRDYNFGFISIMLL
jgi:hypothetical protein